MESVRIRLAAKAGISGGGAGDMHRERGTQKWEEGVGSWAD